MPERDPVEGFLAFLERSLPADPDRQASRSLLRLAKETERLVQGAFRQSKRPRPSAVRKKLERAATQLERAADNLQQIGEEGILLMYVASGVARMPADFSPERHLAYLRRLAEWARAGAETAAEMGKSELDDHGGRTSDARLKSSIVMLAEVFLDYTGIKPTHSEHEGYGSSLFDKFVQEALFWFAPSDCKLPERGIDNMIETVVKAARSMSYLEPPPDFFDER